MTMRPTGGPLTIIGSVGGKSSRPPAWLIARLCAIENSKTKAPLPWSSLTEFLTTFNLPQRRPYPWRLTPEMVLGEINGIPGSRGWLVARSGPDCLLWHPEGMTLFEGHFEWFVPDSTWEEPKPKPRRARPTREEEIMKLLGLCL